MNKPTRTSWDKFVKIIRDLQIKYPIEKTSWHKPVNYEGYDNFIFITNEAGYPPAVTQSFGTIIDKTELYEVEQLVFYKLDDKFDKEKLYEFLTELVDIMSNQSETKYTLNIPTDLDGVPTITWSENNSTGDCIESKLTVG